MIQLLAFRFLFHTACPFGNLQALTTGVERSLVSEVSELLGHMYLGLKIR